MAVIVGVSSLPRLAAASEPSSEALSQPPPAISAKPLPADPQASGWEFEDYARWSLAGVTLITASGALWYSESASRAHSQAARRFRGNDEWLSLNRRVERNAGIADVLWLISGAGLLGSTYLFYRAYDQDVPPTPEVAFWVSPTLDSGNLSLRCAL